MKLAFYPAFSDRATFIDHFYRLHWYLLPFSKRIDEVVLPHDLEDPTPDEVPSYLDSHLADLVGALPITLSHAQTDDDLATTLDGADYVFVWSSPALSDSALQPFVREARTIKIDHENEKPAGSFYLMFAMQFDRDQAEAVARSRDRFERMRSKFNGEVGYIFGTGPDLSTAAAQHDFSDGVAIACNSMVRNHDLLDKLQPPLIAVADPIFHSGASSYAEAFRSELVRALDRYDADLVVPIRDIHVYETHLPDRFTDRIIGIPFEARNEPNLDLASDFSVTTTANILTLYLLPLACTLFGQIRIMGCDGRPAHENSYFWSHDKASQINEEMDPIQTAHPAFFSVDYDEYYEVHCDTLEAWLAAAENAGKVIENLSPSHIPALMRRTYPARRGDYQPTVSVVMYAFNAAEFIDAAIESVFSRGPDDLELLVIEDGSDDKTADHVYRWASRDRRVTLLRNNGKGVSSARHLGQERAGGQNVIFLDAEDPIKLGPIDLVSEPPPHRRDVPFAGLDLKSANLESQDAMSIESSIEKHDWYHAIDLGGGVVTPGRFPPDIPPNYTIFPVWSMLEEISVAGQDCIDVGTTDGMVAFTLKQEGAATVVGTDRGRRETFPLIRDHLGLDISYLPGSTLDGSDIANKLEADNLPAKYDLVVLSGVIYQAYDPLIVLMLARKLLKTNGLFIVETVFHDGEDAALYFNPEAPQPVGEPNTYFLPTLNGLKAMLSYTSCNTLATIVNGTRLAVLAQACRPGEIADKSETLDLMIERGAHYGPLSFDELESDQSVSTIEYTGRRGTWDIDPKTFVTRFPLQPAIR